MTRWWWVRHGPTHDKAFVGWRDVPADLGDKDAIARLEAHLPGDAVLLSSDLSRARDTGDAIQGGRTRLPDEPGLREFDFGAWDGLHFDAVAARDPELSRRFWETPGDVAAPGGESWHQVAARVQAVVARISARHSGGDIIAVAHFGVILSQVALCRGQTVQTALAHRIDPLSVTRVDWTEAGGGLGRVNHNP